MSGDETENPAPCDIALRYLLNELKAEDRKAFEEKLRNDPRLQDDCDRLEQTIATSLLANCPSMEPPAELRKKLLDNIRDEN